MMCDVTIEEYNKMNKRWLIVNILTVLAATIVSVWFGSTLT